MRLQEEHRTQDHCGFDAYEGMNAIFELIMTMPEWTYLFKLQVMAMHLYCFCHGHCPCSELAQYCVDVNDVSLPKYQSAYDRTGLPKYLNVVYRYWKGRRRSEQGTDYPQQFRRNPHNVQADPIYWIVFWLTLGGHADRGPFFGRLDTKRRGNRILQADHIIKDENGYDIWYTKEGRRVNYTDVQIRSIFTKITKRCALFFPREHPDDDNWNRMLPHDWRVSFVAWVGRCNGDQNQARKGARVADSSTEFYKYWNLGVKKRERYLDEVEVDPIWTFNPFFPEGVTYSGTGLYRRRPEGPDASR